MKILTTILLLSFSYSVCAQQSIFVRVYDLTGKKINKGHVLSVTDTSLHLKESRRAVIIPVENIGYIKTKRSEGHNVVVGSLIGLAAGAILGAATAEPDAEIMGYTAVEGAAIGGILGSSVGAAIGGITLLGKNSQSYMINGDVTKWKTFQLMVNGDRHK